MCEPKFVFSDCWTEAITRTSGKDCLEKTEAHGSLILLVPGAGGWWHRAPSNTVPRWRKHWLAPPHQLHSSDASFASLPLGQPVSFCLGALFSLYFSSSQHPATCSGVPSPLPPLDPSPACFVRYWAVRSDFPPLSPCNLNRPSIVGST